LRILHLGKYYPPAPGGIESHVQTLARGQNNLGHDVAVLCVNHTDKNGKDIMHSRWRRTPCATQRDGNVRIERVGRLFGINRLEVCPKLLGRISAFTSKADVVHLHTPNPLMLVAWWLVGKRSTPLVVTHHSDVIKQKLLQTLVAPFESKVYGAARKILSDSPNYIDGSLVLQKFKEKVDVLPLGIDLGPFLNPEKKELEEAKQLQDVHGKPLWLMVGRMTYYKGYHVALEALVQVEGRLIVVGTGPLEPELKVLAQRLGVFERVVWMRSVSKNFLVALYHAATALWFPSIARSEGFGLVQVEAMACGCPVINTFVPDSGVSWVSLDDVTGVTVPVGDAVALGRAATKLLENNELAKKLGKMGKERTVSLFDSAKMALQSINIYKSVA
jgi:glycosyltransferase involved in cell wall biosynthesis